MVNRNLVQLTIILALIVTFPICLDAFVWHPQSKHDRDRHGQDHFGNRMNQRRTRGPSKHRQPTQIQRFRTIDGTMNNYIGVYWGAAGVNLVRRVTPAYADGVSAPAGAHRLSARSISNLLCQQSESTPNARGLSSMVWQWGQFLDHDISITEPAHPLEPLPISVPVSDVYFDPFGAGGQSIAFFRSEFRQNRPASEPRQQVNELTSWIDGSNVYGSDDTTSRSLRTLKDGLMKTSDGDLLPLDDDGFFLAGDVRANEQVCLTAMHTLFVREHNRIAIRYKQLNPRLNDEQIFVRARRRVTGIIQAITFNEFLPAVMGDNALRPYRGYNPMVFPNISNTFSTAAYRFGHSMLNTNVWRVNNDGSKLDAGHLELRDAFFNPDNLTEFGIDPYLKGLTLQTAQELDTRIVDDLRNFLFGGPGSGGFDLAALNIQRGRDHGLADLNSIRRHYGLTEYTQWEQITSDVSLQLSLQEAYATVDDIDPWVGMLAETHLPDASIGETLFTIFRQQFEALRDGDRFYYELDFRGNNLEVIRNTTLAQIISRNSGVRNMQPNVFLAPPIQ